MGHRTHRNPVTVTRRAASRVQARACVVSLAPVLAALVALTAGDHQDASGRLLRYVMLPSGEHVNATLIREGYATAIRTFPYSRHAECLQLEAQARAARRGQWGR